MKTGVWNNSLVKRPKMSHNNTATISVTVVPGGLFTNGEPHSSDAKQMKPRKVYQVGNPGRITET